MRSDDTFCSSSGSSDRPFHSTPVKTKVEFVSRKILIGNGVDSDNEVSEQTLESPGGHTTAVTATKSLTSTPLNSTSDHSDVTSQDSVTPANIVTSAWEHWLLRKEKQRRMQLRVQLEQKQEQIEDEKRLMEVKIRQKKTSEEHYQKWLHRKKSELQKQREEERRLNTKRERDASVARQKAKLMTEVQLKKWKERKLREKTSKVQNGEENAKSTKETAEHRRKCDSVFRQWLRDHQNWQRDHYSYGYAGGIIVSYYDATSPPPPTFFNPHPWL